jgi:hypothetical protein
MTTQYTTILKLALPVQGELSGSWGDVVNDNITEMVEEAVAGLATINSWTANSHTLTTANGTTSESRCAVLVADDDGGGNPSAAATIICPAATKLYVLKNISGQQVTLKTAAGTGVAVPNGSTGFLFCDGTNVEACQTDIIDATTIDTTNLEVTNIKAKDGTASGSIANSTGVFTINSAVLTTADINGGTIDNAAIGGSTPAAGAFTTLDATGDVTGANFQPDGGTSAGDAAAVGYTAAGGLILTGQGSTNDVTIKNDADADVIEIPTGTQNVTMAGGLDVVGVATAATFEPDGDTSAGDAAAVGYTAAEGLILTGQGSTNDVTIKNDADANVIEIPTGTTDVTVAGKFTGGKIVLAATDTDTSNTGSVTIDFSTNQNFVLTLTGSVTLANPSTESVGQAGVFVFIQDATGGRTLSLGTDYESPAGAGIVLSTAANAVDVVPYFVKASGSILLGAPQLAFA